MSLDTSKYILQYQVLDLEVGITLSGAEAREIIEDHLYNAIDAGNNILLSYNDVPTPGVVTISTTESLSTNNLTVSGSIIASSSGTQNIGTTNMPFGNVYADDVYVKGSSLHIGDNVTLTEYNNTDLSINDDVYLSQGAGTTFYSPSGSSAITFKLANNNSAGDFIIADSDAGKVFGVNSIGVLDCRNDAEFSDGYGPAAVGGKNLYITMGDAIGAKKVSFRDSADAEVASIDSDGNITASGTIGWDTVQLSEYNNTDLSINSDIRLTTADPVIHATSLTDGGALTIKLATGAKNEQHFKIVDASDAVQFQVNGDTGETYFHGVSRYAESANWQIASQSGYGFNIRMGDNAGATKVEFWDSVGTECAYIDSDGELGLRGDIDFALANAARKIISDTGYDVGIQMGDNAGANYLNFLDSDAATVAWIDSNGNASFTSISGTIISDGSVDHGSLGGLADDDHTQYLLADGTRALAGDWTTGSGTISGTGDIYCTDLFTSASSIHLGDLDLSFDGFALDVPANLNAGGDVNVGADVVPTESGTSSLGADEKPWVQVYLADQLTGDTYSITVASGTLVATLL
jgi:hypothetical protein